MNTDRIWLIASVAVMAIVAAAGWFLGVSPIVSSAVAASEQVSTITASNAASLTKVSTLKAQYADIGELQAALDKLRESIPETANAPAFLQELNALSAAHNVTLTTVTIAAATVYVAPTDPAGTATSTTTSTATPTPTPTTAPTTTAPTTTPAGQFVLVPVVIAVTGSFSDVRDFIGAVQGGSRLYLANSVAITNGASAGSGGGSATGTLTGDIFTLQGTSTPPAGTPAVTPTPTPTDTSTPTPTPTPTDTSIPTISPTPTVTPTP
jgi:Tfp pilus assembly protein PilO